MIVLACTKSLTCLNIFESLLCISRATICRLELWDIVLSVGLISGKVCLKFESNPCIGYWDIALIVPACKTLTKTLTKQEGQDSPESLTWVKLPWLPIFWPNMILTPLRFHEDKLSVAILKNGWKMWLLESSPGFSWDLTQNPIHDSMWPNFKFIQDMKTNILFKFHEIWAKNVASRVFIRFF